MECIRPKLSRLSSQNISSSLDIPNFLYCLYCTHYLLLLSLKPYAEIAGQEGLNLYEKMPINLKKVHREINDHIFEQFGETFLNLREPKIRFDYLKQEIQLGAEVNTFNKVVANEIKNIADSQFGFSFSLKWFKLPKPTSEFFGGRPRTLEEVF